MLVVNEGRVVTIEAAVVSGFAVCMNHGFTVGEAVKEVAANERISTSKVRGILAQKSELYLERRGDRGIGRHADPEVAEFRAAVVKAFEQECESSLRYGTSTINEFCNRLAVRHKCSGETIRGAIRNHPKYHMFKRAVSR